MLHVSCCTFVLLLPKSRNSKHRIIAQNILLDLSMGLFRGAVFHHGGVLENSPLALMGRFASLRGHDLTLMARSHALMGRSSLLTIPWKKKPIIILRKGPSRGSWFSPWKFKHLGSADLRRPQILAGHSRKLHIVIFPGIFGPQKHETAEFASSFKGFCVALAKHW